MSYLRPARRKILVNPRGRRALALVRSRGDAQRQGLSLAFRGRASLQLAQIAQKLNFFRELLTSLSTPRISCSRVCPVLLKDFRHKRFREPYSKICMEKVFQRREAVSQAGEKHCRSTEAAAQLSPQVRQTGPLPPLLLLKSV